MTILEKIMELLRDRELTSLEIASEINIPKNNCSAYLNTLYNNGRIESKKDKRPYKYRIAETPKSLLKQLYSLMNEKMDFAKTPDQNDVNLIKRVEMVI